MNIFSTPSESSYKTSINNSRKSSIYYSPPVKNRKKKNYSQNFLTEHNYNLIQSYLKKDYFQRLNNASINKYKPILIEAHMPTDDDAKKVHIPHKNKILDNIGKQIVFSNHIRKVNYSWIKDHPRKAPKSDKDPHIENQILNNTEEYKKELLERLERKEALPGFKKVVKDDPNGIKYDIGYIDEVEKLYIKPYLKKDNKKYVDYVPMDRSKIPFNFIIK